MSNHTNEHQTALRHLEQLAGRGLIDTTKRVRRSIGLSELEALLRATDNKIGDAQFDITVTYFANGVLITDVINQVKISEWEKGMAQNDKFAEHTLPFIALGIDYNV